MAFKDACFVFLVAAICVSGIQVPPVTTPQPSDWVGSVLDVQQDIINTQGTQQRYHNSYSDGNYGVFSHQIISSNNGDGESVLVSYNVFNVDGNLDHSQEKSYPLTNGGDVEIQDSIEQYKDVINQQERKANEEKSGSGNFAEFTDVVSYDIDQEEGTNHLVINSYVFEGTKLKMSKTKTINLATGDKSEIEKILENSKSQIRVGPKKKKSKDKKKKSGTSETQAKRSTAVKVMFTSSQAGGVTSIAATCKTYVNGSRVNKFTKNYTTNNKEEIYSIKENFMRNVCK